MSDPLERHLAPLRRDPGGEPSPLSSIAARAARLRRRRRQRGTAVGSLLAAGLVAGLLTAGPFGGGSVTVTSPPTSPTPATGPSPTGELAYVSGHSLVIIDRSGRRHTVALPGSGVPSAPAWSADGQWLAFLRLAPATAAFGPPGTLWVVRADGTGAHPLGAAGQFAWDPAQDTLAFTSTSGRLALASMGGAPARIAPLGRNGTPESLSWSPAGNTLAVATVTYGRNGGTGHLVLLAAGAHRARVLATSQAYGFDLAGWWPDGRGLLYWKDEAFSASIAADGLPLVARSLASGATHTIATTLAYPDWLAWSPGGTLAVVAGADRVVWNGAKHLLLCQVASGSCSVQPQPKGTTSIDPAWAPAGELYFARSTGTAAYTFGAPPGVAGVGGAPFGWKAVEGWAAAGGLRVEQAAGAGGGRPAGGAAAGGGGGGAAVAGGAGGQEPTFAGAGILFVRGGSLWLLTDGSSKPIQLTGRLGSYGSADPGYYGYINWRDEFAWHA
ncbi:MAG: hypothetical protein ACYDEN_07930 [Acidimicrobiales bacterium]